MDQGLDMRYNDETNYLTAEKIINEWSEEKIGESGYPFLLNKDGRFLIHPKYEFNEDISKAEDFFKNDPNVQFVSVSIDKSKTTWLKTLKSGGIGIDKGKKSYYTSDNAVNLYTQGLGDLHPVVRNYVLTAYPHPILFDRKGNFVTDKDLRDGTGESLKRAILKLETTNIQ